MRVVSLLPAVVALFVAGAAYGQAWSEYENRDDLFAVNFPGDPAKTETTYKTPKGTSLPAHVYTAQATGILAGTYTMTVVDYRQATAEVGTAIDDAAKLVLAKGASKYDGVEHSDQIRSRRLTVETDAKRILAEILVHENRLYIAEAETAIDITPPAQFQASVQILDAEGKRIRYRTVGSTERVR